MGLGSIQEKITFFLILKSIPRLKKTDPRTPNVSGAQAMEDGNS
jgi:hypothetical protein